MRIATWNVRTWYIDGAINEMVKEMDNYKVDIRAMHEIRWPGRNCGTKELYGFM
jgi:hypothetical protein